MQPTSIAITVCFLVWAISFFTRRKCDSEDKEYFFFLNLEMTFICVGWIFIGMNLFVYGEVAQLVRALV